MALPPRPVPIPTPHAAFTPRSSLGAPCAFGGRPRLSLPASAVNPPSPEPALETGERPRPHAAKENTETSVGDGDVRTSRDGALKAVAPPVGRTAAMHVS